MLTSFFHPNQTVMPRRTSARTQVNDAAVKVLTRLVAILPVAVVISFGDTLAPAVFMWLLAVVVFAGCKAITFIDAWLAGDIHFDRRGLTYLFIWPGMDTRPFGDGMRDREDVQHQSALPGFVNLALGVVLLWTLPRALIDQSALAAGWAGMIATALILHFGLFRLLAVALQRGGINAQSIMDAPFVAAHISEFWSKRWNRAFNVLANQWVLRPVTKRLNLTAGVLAAFAFSGLIHDLVITLPLGRDYGKPTLFFMIQAAAVWLSRSPIGRRLGLNRGLMGRAFCLLVVCLPMGLCFPPAFVHEIALPWFEMIGAVELTAAR